MAVQTKSGPIVVDADDLQFTHRGKTIAVKVRKVSWVNVLGVVKQDDGSWKVECDLTDDLFSSDPPNGGDEVGGWVQEKAGGDMVKFVRDIIIPRLNAWLAKLFPPVVTQPGTPTGTPVQQLQTVIGGIKFTTAADGTVKASI